MQEPKEPSYTINDVQLKIKKWKPRQPYTLEDLKRDQDQHHDALERAIYKYGPKRDLRQERKLREALTPISHSEKHQLAYMNPYARSVWQNYLLNAIGDGSISAPLYMTTIIDQDWNFSDQDWLLEIDRMKQQVRNRFQGPNYIFMIEFAVFRNVRPTLGKGRVIAPHIQGFSWGQISRREMKRIYQRFTGGMFGADSIRRQVVYDLPGAISYSVKPPYHGYSVYPKQNGTFGHKRCELSLTQHYALFQHLKDFTYLDMTFASGEGVPILREARSLARRS
jgi:hypothetical protein